MTELDRLPPDQRAVLSLVLDRGKSYGEVAAMLAIPESAVRERAHAALDALARNAASASTSPTPAPAPAGAAGVPGGHPSPRGAVAHTASTRPSSRAGGALLLGAIVAVIVVAAILISGTGGKGSSPTSTAASSTQRTATSSTTSTAGKASLDKTIALSPAEPALKATGKALVLSEGGRYAFYIQAQGLPASSGFFYAAWLYNSPSAAKPLGRAPSVGANGLMEGGGPLPANASDYARLVITRETSTHPAHPGPIVMGGPFALH
jgi:Sigma-70, region 4